MPSFTAIALPLLCLLAQTSLAQDEETRIKLYSKPGCKNDPVDPDFRTHELIVFKQNAKSDNELTCSGISWDNDDWPSDEGSGRKQIWVDASGIDTNCKLLMYEINRDADMTRECVSTYIKISSTASCVGTAVPDSFGYSYCCGDGCGQNEVEDLFPDKATKRTLPQPPPVDDLFVANGHAAATRDVTLSKRRPAFDLIKREDCKWNNKGDSDKPYLKYPGQYRVGPITKCQIQDGCEGSIAISYSETVSESFGMSAGAGATLFEVISLSMEFSYSQETAEQNQFTYTHSYSVPYGASGYVAWEPVTECAKGSFSGDCDEWDTDTEGEACFLKMVNNIPDGKYYNVLEYE